MCEAARKVMSNIKEAAMKIIFFNSKHPNEDLKNNCICVFNIFSCREGISLPEL